jgi:transposase-like protein
MGSPRKKSRSRTKKNDDSSLAGDAGFNPRVDRLRRDFAKFRRTHSLRTRIPDSLRNAALAALKSGTTESEVRQACGVTSDQLAYWRKHQPQQGLESPGPRIFPVVDSPAVLSQTIEPEQQDLELRLGGWSICVRPLQMKAR